jgi:hypothetical protein
VKKSVRRVAPKNTEHDRSGEYLFVKRDMLTSAVAKFAQEVTREIVREIRPDTAPQCGPSDRELARPTPKVAKVENTAPVFEHALQVQDQLIGGLHSSASDIESLLDRLAGPEASPCEANGAGPMAPQAGGCVGRVGDHNNGLAALHVRLSRVINRLNSLV